DSAGEQRRPNPAGRTGVVHFLADDHRVDAVAAATADRLGQARAKQTSLTGLAVKLTRQVADALPLVDVRQDLAFGKGAHGLSQLLAFGCVPDVHSVLCSSRETLIVGNSSGMSMVRLRNHSPSPLACGSNRA